MSEPLRISDGALRSEKILEHDKIEEFSNRNALLGLWGKSLRFPKPPPLWVFSPIWIYGHKRRQLEVISQEDGGTFWKESF